MAELVIPVELQARLERLPRRPWNPGPLTEEEREMLALYLEWMAAEVRERPVREAGMEQDFDVERDRGRPTQRASKLSVDVLFG